MAARQRHVVTGAFGYSGKYIARRLLEAGVEVRTLTNAPACVDPFDGRVAPHPYCFGDHTQLVEALRGAAVLYNTYWVRFNRAGYRHAEAVENTLKLFAAARAAGVGRVVHVSITNPSEDSPLEYFSGKAKLERALIESGLSYAILRPTVLFGTEDILINNVAWLLRKVPVFGVFGDGRYRLQPIYVDDLAALAVRGGRETQNCTIDASGPETFTFRELVEQLGSIIGKPRPIVCIPPTVGYFIGAALGRLVGDVIITREEIAGLMAELLYTDSPPAGETRLTDWARANAATLGRRYASELGRRRRRGDTSDARTVIQALKGLG
ncbi:MAG TPA: NAD(P)H-binding protein [Phycisphaerae bacterium]|nr:NAD(P)H-binding protein [Phycisphaerae bacterium]HNU46946.1 NAD(P)H-binding protein [Phycisphaerae bacterium]